MPSAGRWPASARPLPASRLIARTVMSWSQRIWQLSRTVPEQAAGLEHVLLGDRHLVRLAGDELDPTGGAPGVAAAGVELVDLGVVLEGQDQALVGRHVKRADPVHRQLRHRRGSAGCRATTEFSLTAEPRRGNQAVAHDHCIR